MCLNFSTGHLDNAVKDMYIFVELLLIVTGRSFKGHLIIKAKQALINAHKQQAAIVIANVQKATVATVTNLNAFLNC